MTVDEFLAEWHSADEGLWVHTSGTTGAPKPMYVLKRQMLRSARATCDFLGLQQGDTAFLCMSVDYIAGKMMVVRSLERGLQLVQVPPSGHPLQGVIVPREPASLAAMVPLQVYNSLQTAAEREQLQRFTHVIIGGGAIDAQLERQLRSFPNAIWSSYGMTETLSHVALRRVSGPSASLWYRPLPGVSVSLNDDDCLVIDAPAKRADEKFGEVVVLITTATDLEMVKAVCVAQLPKYWQPHVFIQVDALPLTATGKVARNALLSLAKKV